MKLGLFPHGQATQNKNKQAAQPTFPKTYIAGIGLSCVAGDQPFGLLGMVGAQFSNATTNKEVAIPTPDGTGETFAIINGLPELAGVASANERIQFHAANALQQAVEQLPKDTDWSKLAIVTLLPDPASSRGGNINHDHLWQLFLDIQPSLSNSICKFVPETESGTALLASYCHKLATGELHTVLFGGVDSLVDCQTCTEIALSDRLMAEGGSEGIIPGEGACWLILTQKNQAKAKLPAIVGASHSPEPYPDDAPSKTMTGLFSAMTTTLQQASSTVNQLKTVVLPFCGDSRGELEWYQVTSQIRQENRCQDTEDNTPSRQEPTTIEEWRPHLAIGHTGAATIPINIALACGRLEFTFPKTHQIMICEATTTPVRGAILLHSD